MDVSLMPIGLWGSDFAYDLDVSCIFVAFKIKVQEKDKENDCMILCNKLIFWKLVFFLVSIPILFPQYSLKCYNIKYLILNKQIVVLWYICKLINDAKL